LSEGALRAADHVAALCDRHLADDEASQDAINELVEEKVEALASFARRYVPFYADQGLPRAPVLGDLPVVNKSTLMLGLPRTVAEPEVELEELRAWVPPDERDGQFTLWRNRYYVRRTSGTTGVVGFFLWDQQQAAAADHAQARFLPPLEEMPRPVVVVSPVVALPRYASVLRDMHPIPMGTGLPGTVERLNRLRPATMLGSPAFMALLAEEQLSGRLHVEPQVVAVWTERCLTPQRAVMGEAWHVDPIEPYGTSETSAIAVRCHEGNFHILADHVHVELLAVDGSPVPVGAVADRMLVTRLCGPVQPVLRYELGDVVVRGPDECACRRPFPTFAEVRGRARARLWLASPNRQPVAISAFALIPVLETTPGLVRYQLRYERPGCFEIAVVARPAIDASALRSALVKTVEALGAISPEIAIVDGVLPSIWSAPAGSKDHHVHISVDEEGIKRWIAENHS
jgi:phenylacetate-coenzyme A ligase PaaK-like adenylate-forming protein